MYNSYPPNPPPHGTGNDQPLQMDVMSATHLIENFDSMKLTELQEDGAMFDEFINDLPQVKNIKPQKELLMASNQSQAEFNMQLQPEFTQLKGELISSYDELKSLSGCVVQSQSELSAVKSEQQSPDVLLALLQTEMAQSEEKSEKIASDFLDKSTDIDKFLEDFISAQTLFYSRQFKVGKMKDLLQNQHAPMLPARTNPPTWFQNTPQYPQNTPPYPQNTPPFHRFTAPYPNYMAM